jgi:hypothetical protein
VDCSLSTRKPITTFIWVKAEKGLLKKKKTPKKRKWEKTTKEIAVKDSGKTFTLSVHIFFCLP